MIYTRFGTPIEIIEDTGEGWAKVKLIEADNTESIHEWHISELKADNGLAEIMEALKKVSA